MDAVGHLHRLSLGWIATLCLGLAACRAGRPLEGQAADGASSLAVADAEPAEGASAAAVPGPAPALRGPLARRKVSGADPRYPEMSQRLREEGVVELGVEVDNDGALIAVRVLGSSGHERLDAAAVQAVRTWTFAPRTGAEASMVYRQRFVFRLETPR